MRRHKTTGDVDFTQVVVTTIDVNNYSCCNLCLLLLLLLLLLRWKDLFHDDPAGAGGVDGM